MSFVEEDEHGETMVDSLAIEDAIETTSLAADLQQFEEIEGVHEVDEPAVEEVLTLETLDIDDGEELMRKTMMEEKPKTSIPPLRPLTIAPKPAKVPVTFKTMGNQQLLLVQGTGSGQQIKLLSTGQGLSLSNLTLAKPLTIKQTPRTQTQTLSLMQPKKMVMKKVIPKVVSKSSFVDGSKVAQQQIVVLQKSDAAAVKLLPTVNSTKTLTLGQTQMGMISSAKMMSPASKQIVVNKTNAPKSIKLIPHLRSPTKILPAPQSTPPKTTQRIILKQTSVAPTTAQLLPGQIIQMPNNGGGGQVHQINIPGKGMQYIKFIATSQTADAANPMASTTGGGTKVTVAKITSSPTGSAAPMKPLIKIGKPMTPSVNFRTMPKNASQIVINRSYTPAKVISYRVAPKTSLADAVVPSTPKSPEITVESNGIKARKPCNCAKSQCLKLYCDCFANGEFCYMCNCMNCYNNLENEEHRQRAIKNCLERNPNAFRPKIGKGKDTGETVRKHTKGCNCKRSGCLKNYCECYEAKIACSNNCKCMGCKNVETSFDAIPSTRATIMETFPALSVTRKLPLDVGFKLKKSTMIKQPFNFINSAVIEATTECLVTIAKNAESLGQAEDMTKKEILEEFGRCLKQIIDCTTGKTIQ